MPKDKDELITFDKKKVAYEETEDKNEDNTNDNFESDFDSDLDEDYEEDTLKLIERNIIQYVDSGIPLCEYINTSKIYDFLNKLKV